MGIHSVSESFKSGLKRFHSNVFDTEKYTVIKAVRDGKLLEVEKLIDTSLKKITNNTLEVAKAQNEDVYNTLKEFVDKNSNSFIGSNAFRNYIKSKKIGRDVLVFKDEYEKYRSVFQSSLDALAKDIDLNDLSDAVLLSVIKKTGAFANESQRILTIDGFRSIEGQIFGNVGMVQGLRDAETSFKTAKEYGGDIIIYNQDSSDFVFNIDGDAKKIGIYMDPPYTESAKTYDKDHDMDILSKFYSGQEMINSHWNVFNLEKQGAKLALTNDVNDEYIDSILGNLTKSNDKLYAYKEEIIKWLALFENSPSLSCARHS